MSEPLELPCGQIIPNRMMKAAMGEGLAGADCAPDERLMRLYSRWAAGGFGLILTGNIMVDRRHLGDAACVAVEDDRHHDQLAAWAAATRSSGAKIWGQVNHPGRQANPMASRAQPVAPSAITSSTPGLPTPRALADDEIDAIVDRFVEAALVLEAAGFDGVQIHGAHGYLVSQFLSPLANTRTDRWGGDLAGRMRFLLEIIRRTRNMVDAEFAVSVKLNSADFQRGGFDEDESRTVIAQLSTEAVDLIEISGGSYEAPAMIGRADRRGASTKAREAYFLDYAASARSAAGSVPLAVTGGFRSRDAMVGALAAGDCDVVGLGRPAALNPVVAQQIIDGAPAAPARNVSLGMPRLSTRIRQVKLLDGLVDLAWHGDQLSRMGNGLDPDPYRPVWRTVADMVWKGGVGALRPAPRSIDSKTPSSKS